jgi:hypothetical protein
MHISQKRIYLDATQTSVVKGVGAFLLVGVGGEISGDSLARYGLTVADLMPAQPEPAKTASPAQPEPAKRRK